MTLYGKDDHDQTGWEDLKKYCGSAENDIGDTSDAKHTRHKSNVMTPENQLTVFLIHHSEHVSDS